MYTYTFSKEHLYTIMMHITGTNIPITSVNLNNTTYTLVCGEHIDQTLYSHLQQFTNLEEVV